MVTSVWIIPLLYESMKTWGVLSPHIYIYTGQINPRLLQLNALKYTFLLNERLNSNFLS